MDAASPGGVHLQEIIQRSEQAMQLAPPVPCARCNENAVGAFNSWAGALNLKLQIDLGVGAGNQSSQVRPIETVRNAADRVRSLEISRSQILGQLLRRGDDQAGLAGDHLF